MPGTAADGPVIAGSTRLLHIESVPHLASSPSRHRSDWLYARNRHGRTGDRGINPLATHRVSAPQASPTSRHRSDWLYARNRRRRTGDRGINPLATHRVSAPRRRRSAGYANLDTQRQSWQYLSKRNPSSINNPTERLADETKTQSPIGEPVLRFADRTQTAPSEDHTPSGGRARNPPRCRSSGPDARQSLGSRITCLE